MKQYKSEALASIHETMESLMHIGTIDKETMLDFDKACLSQTGESRMSEQQNKLSENEMKMLHIIGFLNWAGIPATQDLSIKLFHAFDACQIAQIIARIIDTPRWNQMTKELEEAHEMLDTK